MAEAYLPLRQCVEILGAELAPAVMRSLLLECLNGIKCKVCACCMRRPARPRAIPPHAVVSALPQACSWHTRLCPVHDPPCSQRGRALSHVPSETCVRAPSKACINNPVVCRLIPYPASICRLTIRLGVTQVDWQVRRQATETLASLAAAIQARHAHDWCCAFCLC